MLVSWILEQERLRHALTYQQIREFTAKICGCFNKDLYIDKHWLIRFIGKNPAFYTKVERKINY
jgi:hypothetical protein